MVKEEYTTSSSSEIPRSYLSFFLLPVLGTMLKVPTMNISSESVLNGTHTGLSRNVLRRHFVFSKVAWKQGRWWTAITHMFLHMDNEHLVGNAIALTMAGMPIARNYGTITCYVVFLGGGISSAISCWGQSYQWLQSFRGGPASEQSTSSSWWGESSPVVALQEMFDTHILQKVAPILVENVGRIGCSAGITALNGMDFMHAVEKAVVSAWYPSNRFDPSIMLHIMRTVTYLSVELTSVSSGNSSEIDHAGHLSGFGFGVVCYGISKAVSYYSSRMKNGDDLDTSRLA
jgi:membrane associated rhomboid family serine protease